MNALFMMLVMAAPLRADPALESPFRQAQGIVQGARAEPDKAAARRSVPYPAPRESYAGINACWERPAQPEIDAFNVPLRICIRRVGVAVPRHQKWPFNDMTGTAAFLLEGDPISGRFHISGGARQRDGWEIIGEVFESRKPIQCGQFNMAAVAVYACINEAGDMRGDIPELRGFLMDGGIMCPNRAEALYFNYTRITP